MHWAILLKTTQKLTIPLLERELSWSLPQWLLSGKSKGKLVRSNLTLEQRRAKPAEIKRNSKCLGCGGTGHWAGGRFLWQGKDNDAASQPYKATMVAYRSASSHGDDACALVQP